MGAKKKAAKKKGGDKKDDEEDMSLENFIKFYKRNCNELACPYSKIIKEKFDECVEEDTLI